MKRHFNFFYRSALIICFLISTILGIAQNIGIGINQPLNKLQVMGNVLFNEQLVSTNQMPSATQTKTMVNGSYINFLLADSVMRLYDPSGPSANYIDNLNSSATTYPPYPGGPGSEIGFEMIVEEMDLKTGDSLIIRDYSGNIVFAVGNNYNTTGRTIFNSSGLSILFKSNGDGINGAGFKLLFRKYYSAPIVPISGLVGKGFFFDVSKGSFKGGMIASEAAGNYSFSLGYYSSAVGYASVALGHNSKATGFQSIAIGSNCQANAEDAVALGNSIANGPGSISAGVGNTTQGYQSVALGYFNTAGGHNSTAIGFVSHALGDYSTAIGYNNDAVGISSTALGSQTNSGGTYSMTAGLGTISPSFASLSLGRYNYSTPTSAVSWVTTDPVLIVGNGTGNATRSNILEFYKNGNLTILGTLTQFSDARLKSNITPLRNSLQKISKLNGYNYNWKNKEVDPSIQTGLLAQEVQKVMPELVGSNLKGELTLNYNGLIPHLIESIKELNKTIDWLIKKVDYLEKQK